MNSIGSISRYWVIIPALNEEKSISLVIQDLKTLNHPPEKIIVSDNGSEDNTGGVALNYGAIVVEELNKGYGNACLKAMELLKDEAYLPDAIVFMDGDYSDDPKDLPNLLKEFTRNESIVAVLGSRTMGNPDRGSLSPFQRFGNWLSCYLINFFYKAKYTDLGPFRAIRTDSLLQLNMQDRNYGWTVELQCKLAQEGMKFQEVPVSYRKRNAGDSKVSGNAIGSFLAGMKILSTIFSLYLSHKLNQMKDQSWIRFLVISYLVVFLALFVPKTNVLLLIIVVSIIFIILLNSRTSNRKNDLLNIRKKKSIESGEGDFYILTGLLMRFPLLFVLPLLSDDFYRTIWDAQVIFQGFNPYEFTPIEIYNSIQASPNDYTNSWIHTPYFEKLNSQNFFSFYPPLQHGISMFSLLIGNISFGNYSNLGPYKSMIGLKSLFFIAEFINLLLLKRLLKYRESNLKFYAWNPLIILEGIGNLHFEIFLTTGLLGFFLFWRKFHFRAGLSLALGIGVKLTPLLLIPNIFLRLIRMPISIKNLLYYLLPGIAILGIWLGLMADVMLSQWELGVGLYSHSFEFFSLVNRYLRIGLSYYNIDYLHSGFWIWMIAGFFLFLVFLQSSFKRKRGYQSPEFLYFLLIGVVFFFSPVVHPWYIIPWVATGIIIGNRSSILASFLIFSSYSYYSTTIYQRNEMIVVFSYILFFLFLIWEIYEHKHSRNSIRSIGSTIRNLH